MGKHSVTYLEFLEQAILNGNKSEISKLLRRQNAGVKNVNKDGDSVLHLTLKSFENTQTDMIEILNLFFDRGVDPNIKNNAQETVLHLAIAKQLKNVIALLLKHNAEIDMTDSEGNSITHFFVQNQTEQLLKWTNIDNEDSQQRSKRNIAEKESRSFVEWLLSRGFDFDYENEMGQSALHWAIEYNLQHILPALFMHTRNINFISKHGQETFLHLFLKASNTTKSSVQNITHQDPETEKKKGKVEFRPKYKIHADTFSQRYSFQIIKILIERGVPVDRVDKNGLTALQVAISAGEQLDIIELLSEQSTKINGKCGGKMVHQMVKQATCEDADIEYYSKVLRALITKGADVNYEDEQDMIPVYHAVKKRNLRVIELMKGNGADLSLVTKSGRNSLFWLAHKDPCNEVDNNLQEALFDLLVNEGCNVNARGNGGQTPLHLASKTGNIVIVRKLLAHGADVDSRRTYEEKTPLHLAVEKGFSEVAESLLEHAADVDSRDSCGDMPLHLALKRGLLKMVKPLLDHGADVNSRGSCGDTPLHVALKQEFLDTAKLLLDRGADINGKDSCGDSCLHWAVKQGHEDITRMLLDKGADINGKNGCGDGLLHLAVKRGCTTMAELLLDHGANIDEKNSCGDRPLHLAAALTRDKMSMLQMLLRRGALVNARNSRGESAIWKVQSVSKRARFTEILEDSVNELLAYGADIGDNCVVHSANYDTRVLFEYWIKLKVAKLPCSKDYETFVEVEKYKKLFRICQREVEALKCTYVDTRTSLYTWLHMNLNRRYAHCRNEKLKELIGSPNLTLQFPKYSTVILDIYRGTLVRKSLLEPAKQALLMLTDVPLPDVCLQQIIIYLSSGDLITIIEMNKEDELLNEA